MPIKRKKPPVSTGIVTARPRGKRSWLFNYLDEDGIRQRITMHCYNLEEAQRKAWQIHTRVSAGLGSMVAADVLEAKRRKDPGLTIRDAMIRWKESLTTQTKGTVSDYRSCANDFGRWLAAAYPEIKLWKQLQGNHVSEYITQLSRAYDTKRHKLNVIGAMSKFMHRLDPKRYANFMEGVEIHIEEPEKVEKCLPTQAQLDHILSWFRQNHPCLWVHLLLGAYAGVRGYEAAYLQVEDIDFARGVISIRSNAHHKVKTKAGARVIPVLPIILNALREYRDNLPARPFTGPFFFSDATGKPITNTNGKHGQIKGLRRRAFSAYKQHLARENLPSLPDGFILRETRHIFLTACLLAGIPEDWRRKYYGHRNAGVDWKAYDRSMAENLRRIVLEPIERQGLQLPTETRKALA